VSKLLFSLLAVKHVDDLLLVERSICLFISGRQYVRLCNVYRYSCVDF
jgi:hypothetical protein